MMCNCEDNRGWYEGRSWERFKGLVMELVPQVSNGVLCVKRNLEIISYVTVSGWGAVDCADSDRPTAALRTRL
eukprot:1811209-Rhodomonas_salina.1